MAFVAEAKALEGCLMYHVYWIRDASCTDPFRHGYIGVTDNTTRRRRDHRRITRLLRDDCVFVVLHTTQKRAECLVIERKYRPERFIGWNRQRGGERQRGRRLSRRGLRRPRINAAAIGIGEPLMTDFFNPAKPGTKRHRIVEKLATSFPRWVARTDLAALSDHPSLNVVTLGKSLHLNIETEHRDDGVYHRLDPANAWGHQYGRRIGKLRQFWRTARAERDAAKARIRDLEAQLAAIRNRGVETA